MAKIYLVGSLRNPAIPAMAAYIRDAGYEVFDDWHAAGERADDSWRDYEMSRGRSYREALEGHAATHVFEFDRRHLERSDIVVLALPAGKSGHLELGVSIGEGKRGFVILGEEYDRWDVMYKFAEGVFDNVGQLINYLELYP